MKNEPSIMENWKSKKIKLSICCTAYNHESYIEEALKGFLEQQTDFAFEIIISDDCSTDGTTKILNEYADRYPNIIRLIYQKENQYSKGALPIRDFILPEVRGEYIALCEGDDYWTDPNKLQKQVDFLEKHHDFIGCGHNTRFLIDGELTDRLFVKPETKIKEQYVFNDFIDSAYMHTTSLVLRYNKHNKSEIDMCLSKYSNVERNDVYMLLVFSKFGPIKYIDEIMSIYRMNAGGIWSGSNDDAQLKMFLKGCVDFSYLFGDEYKSKFLYSFANTLSEESATRTEAFVTDVLDDLSEQDLKTVLRYFAIFKKRDNDTIKDCSKYIDFLEFHFYDNSFKSLLVKLSKFLRLHNLLKKIKK
ncbi:glycosyltransferase [Francisella philomiragia]|uniref:Glycosyl transferase 2 family protein n=1 Tax=Francisella philomiragia TaxID=28110 RepID=A0AAW3DAG3_9GAMM|nr:glycosyltransferase [Francisella philomiragia]KFJ42511.1 glycosyl transferase 2 family protein [Francisella philomiragia]MBK2092371.1 glycosyltransferase [Francisella philomiragia]MBK2255593.1 glycosyltransferase [Francisella philomiragia]MBK2257408.1 glycosyltransferase [Francisella philomiragia]MBK2270092.1 glycosyltransferase [Francisella philomiragia]